MDFSTEILPGARHVRLKRLADTRGEFVKTYVRSAFEAHGVCFDFSEEFYSVSHKDVVRGMHFQLPPHDHEKLVFCPCGLILDVLVDLRRGPGFGRVASTVLSGSEPAVLVIPTGVAHGFKSLSDSSVMIYKTSAEYAPSHDGGIRWDSIDFDWQIDVPILSARDATHPALADFASPF